MTDKDSLLNVIEKVKESVAAGGFPAGAVVTNGKIVGSGISIGNKLNDPTSQIRDACENLNVGIYTKDCLCMSKRKSF